MEYQPGQDAYEIAKEHRKKFNNASLEFARNKHKEKAIKHLQLAASAGHLDAMFDMAILYSNDMYLCEDKFTFTSFTYSFFKENKSKALYWLERCANQNHKKAIHLMIDYYTYKYPGCENDAEKAAYWMEKAYLNGEENYFPGLIGNLYFTREKNYKKGIKYLEKHKPSDEKLSSWDYTKKLADFYQLDNRFEDAFHLYKQISEQDSNAAIFVAKYYEDKKEYKNAVHYYKLGRSYYSLKRLANNNLGITPKDFFEIVKENNIYDYLGICYMYGFGIEKDEIAAFPLLMKYYSRLQNINTLFFTAEFLVALADCYYFGKGTNVDLNKAYDLFLKAEKIDTEKQYDRNYAIAWCAYHLKKYDVAWPRLKTVIEVHNSPWAYHLLGNCYYYGYGCNKNLKEAFKIFENGVNQNNADCANMLGICYLNGQGIEKNTIQAYHYFNKAYELGKTSASAFNIGLCYENAYGCEKELEKAFAWYTISANLGLERAKDKVKELQPTVTKIVKEKEEKKKIDNLANTIVNNLAKKDNLPVVNHTDQNAKAQLQELIGLDSVKKEIQELENFIKVMNLRKARGLPINDISKHMVFTGNPGTGKTTVARIVANIYKENGILEKGHLVETDRDGLVGRYIGETGKKTRKIIESAMGGVLFIDEAYSLVPKDSDRDFGPEAVATLLKMMEDYKNDFVVIVAGYKEEMEFFIDSNPGLKSRFTSYVDFPDYTPEELHKMFEIKAKKAMFTIDAKANEKLLELWHQVITYENFGNGRCVRNVFEKIQRLQSNRIIAENILDDIGLSTIKAMDIPSIEDIFN